MVLLLNNITKYGLQSDNDIVFANSAVEALVISPKGTTGAILQNKRKEYSSFDNTVDENGTDRTVFTVEQQID